MPNVMVALPNIGGALCSTPQSLVDTHYQNMLCSNAAKTRNPLKFAGVPQTRQQISAASGPKFGILWGHVLNKFFFPIVDTCLSCRPTVPVYMYAYVPNFVSIGLFCRSLLAKTPSFAVFWTSAFSVVANWQQSEKVEHGCTTTNLPLSNGIRIVSVLQNAFRGSVSLLSKSYYRA